MKPHSLVVILIRLAAIYIFVAGILTTLGPLAISAAFSDLIPAASATLGATHIEKPSSFSEIYKLQLAISSTMIAASIILYIWSKSLGKLIAKGIE